MTDFVPSGLIYSIREERKAYSAYSLEVGNFILFVVYYYYVTRRRFFIRGIEAPKNRLVNEKNRET